MDLAQKPVYKLDLAAGTSVVNLTTPLVEGDDRAQTFTLELTDKGAPANLKGYSVTAYFGRGKTAEAEADTIPLSGTVFGNVATITLTESCYSRSCYFSMPIRLSNGATGQKRTYLIVRGTVVKCVDGKIIDPDGSVPSLDELFAQIAVMERTRQAAEEATEEALAAAAKADEAREGIQGDLATLSKDIDYIFNQKNLLLKSRKHDNAYYYESAVSSETYCYFEVEVESGKTYVFGFAPRFVSKAGQNLINGTAAPYTYTADFDGVVYVTYDKTQPANVAWFVCESEYDYWTVGSYREPALSEALMKQELGEDKTATVSQYVVNGVNKTANEAIKNASRLYTKNGVKYAGNLASGGMLCTDEISVKKDCCYVARFGVTNFTDIRIGHGFSGVYSAYFKITPNTLSVVDNDVETVLHQFSTPLTAQYMLVNIRTAKNNTAKVEFAYNGDGFVFDDIEWHGYGYGKNYLHCVNGDLTDASFAWVVSDAAKEVCVLGDSYTDLDSGWTAKYLETYDNALFIGFGGAGSQHCLYSLMRLINLGMIKPSKVVFATGMNDGADSGNTPNNTWLANANDFLYLCVQNGIEPIFATIPTVPTINNEGKNTWIRNSRYRYVDVAQSVGANANGEWYPNMLGGDGVHPSYRGVTSIYIEYISSVPELGKK